MPIRKETPTRLAKVGSTYTVIPSDTIKLVPCAIGLGILTYLLDKPDNWIPRKTEICAALGIGSDLWKRGIESLKEADLYLVTDVREQGRIIDRIVTVSAEPMGLSPKCGLPNLGETQIKKTPPINITDSKHYISIIKGWEEWVDYRKEIKKKMTASTVKKQVAFLSSRSSDEQQAIIDQSITNGWTGLFEIKEQGNGRARQNGRGNSSAIKTISASDLINQGNDIVG